MVCLWMAKFIYGVLLIVIIYGIVIQIRHRYRARQAILEHIHAEQINEAKLQFLLIFPTRYALQCLSS